MILHPEWQESLQTEIESEYYADIQQKLKERIIKNIPFAPRPEWIFRALNTTPLSDVQVVVLGQDPYHTPSKATGLAFGVPANWDIDASLRNILKEIETDVGGTQLKNGDLTPWATQGVLLLNTVLSVDEGQANSHKNWGWQRLTDTIVHTVSQRNTGCVFLLWGAQAQAKSTLINNTKHLILTAPHPSPLSAYRGWWGCRHFSQTNAYLAKHDKKPIDW